MIFNKKDTLNDTNYTSHNNTLMLKMVTSYSIFLLIILVLFIFLYRSTINNARDSYDQQNETTLISNAELFESDLNIMEVYCRQLLQNDTFRKVMNYENTYYPFTEMGNELQNSLATNVYAEALLPLKESFVYFPETDYVLNPTYFISAKRFYSWIQKYPSTEKEMWRSYMTEPEYENRFLPMDQFMPNYSEKYYMYIIDLNDLYYMDANAKVCFIFEQDKMADLFDCVQMDGDNFLAVTAEDDSTVLTINTPNSISAEMLDSLDFNKGYAEVRIDGQNFTLGKYVSDNTSYSYYFSFPPYKATAGLGGTQLLFIFFALLALLTGGCLVYYFSRRNVRPIIELGQELQTAVEVQKNLQEVVDSQRPIICTSYVRQLLSGTATSEDEVTYMENYLGIADSSYYNVLYIVYYNNFGDNTEITLPGGVESMEELEKIIESALENFFGTPLFYFSPSDRTYSVLLHCSEEEEKDLILKINNCILRLHDYLLDTYDIWLFAGIGRNTDSLMNVWECYQQASEAVSYTTKNYIFFPYEFIKKDFFDDSAPTEIYTDRDGGVIFKKYSLMGGVSEFAGQLCETIGRTAGKIAVITDRDNCVAVTGAPRREIQDKQISPELERLMEGRQIYQHKPGAETIPLCADGTAFHVGTAAPILSEGDVLGCVIFAEDGESQSPAEIDYKLAQAAAAFLGKHMES